MTIANISDTLADLPAGTRVYQHGAGYLRITSHVDEAASTPDATTVRIQGGPCAASGAPVLDGAGAPLLHPERLLVIRADETVDIAAALTAIHQALADEVRIAAEHRAQLDALTGVSG